MQLPSKMHFRGYFLPPPQPQCGHRTVHRRARQVPGSPPIRFHQPWYPAPLWRTFLLFCYAVERHLHTWRRTKGLSEKNATFAHVDTGKMKRPPSSHVIGFFTGTLGTTGGQLKRTKEDERKKRAFVRETTRGGTLRTKPTSRKSSLHVIFRTTSDDTMMVALPPDISDGGKYGSMRDRGEPWSLTLDLSVHFCTVADTKSGRHNSVCAAARKRTD